MNCNNYNKTMINSYNNKTMIKLYKTYINQIIRYLNKIKRNYDNYIINQYK